MTFLLTALLTASLTGCATILKGSEQSIAFNSNPQGAEILIDGKPYGTTPQLIELDVRQSYDVTLRQDGLERTLTLTNSVDATWVILDVVALLVPVLVDASTGDWYTLSPDQVNVDFTADGFVSPTPTTP